jgi:uncharacterized cupin superfamily protein
MVNLKMNAEKNSGEYVFGAADTGSHACYMIYGTLKAGEKGRVIKPGKGHEEMMVAVKGELTLTGDFEGQLREGMAIHLVGEQTCLLENKGTSEAVYLVAGGHSGHGH